MVGRLVHYAADAVLISAVLAGIRRSTGLTFKQESIESKEIRSGINTYLGIGERVFDFGASILASTSYFERKL
ncbi:hypothetical protein IWQ60_000029 [Tieghemiomyces parasiticus]|uniref:DUF1748-domain-containing protein n=1 Tax=Tieghemiomyces parasiticus TaxID=78921 RepID=A0A9W8AFK4_9FUNG|nr:hypothetical protein IWQ60_000029 [Tieghemiomyces parasiticus]